jgi:hypothetical protein
MKKQLRPPVRAHGISTETAHRTASHTSDSGVHDVPGQPRNLRFSERRQRVEVPYTTAKRSREEVIARKNAQTGNRLFRRGHDLGMSLLGSQWGIGTTVAPTVAESGVCTWNVVPCSAYRTGTMANPMFFSSLGE